MSAAESCHICERVMSQGYVVLFKCHELRVGSYPYICELFAELIRDGFVSVLPVSTPRHRHVFMCVTRRIHMCDVTHSYV